MRVCVERTDKEPLNRDCFCTAAPRPPAESSQLRLHSTPSHSAIARARHPSPLAPHAPRAPLTPLTRRARRHSLKMVSLKTAFMVHGVVGFLFCLPIAFGGLKGFLSMMAEPEVVTWDKCVRCPCRALPRAT